jgi:hypothetical protein
MTALQTLAILDQQAKRDLYWNVPEHAIPKSKFSDSNTAGLTQAIICCFKLHGFFVTRIDSKGTWNQGLQRFIPSNQKKGLPDIFAQGITKDGRALPPIWIEVKCAGTKDRLKPHQKQTIEQLKKSGAIVYVATDYQSFYEWFKTELLNNK